jgi:alkanesulfonate monooxygenase
MRADQGADGLPVDVFSTCPSSMGADPATYRRRVREVARWSEQAGCRGILVYTDNGLVDPWLVSQLIVESTERLWPLVAVQPVYMHPYAVAKMVATIGFLYGRRVALNMVAGGFSNDLIALNDTTPHDRRYERLVEYTTIVKQLLESKEPVRFEGAFYRVDKVVLKPSLPPGLQPTIFVSGSSPAGVAAAQAIGAVAVQYPGPPEDSILGPRGMDAGDCGVRVGIIARNDESQAWCVARERFPEDRRGQITHQLASAVSDSAWQKQLSHLAQYWQGPAQTYWLGPFVNYKTFCPYLVGSYGQVAGVLARYMSEGYRTYILDIPPDEEELGHTAITFRRACEMVSR